MFDPSLGEEMISCGKSEPLLESQTTSSEKGHVSTQLPGQSVSWPPLGPCTHVFSPWKLGCVGPGSGLDIKLKSSQETYLEDVVDLLI